MIYADSFSLLRENMSTTDLGYLKEDGRTLISLYRLYSLAHATRQLSTLGAFAKKYKVSNIKTLAPSMLDHNGIDSEHSDYCEDDFKDLMSVQQIEQSIKIFYDKLKELMNPIDSDRL